MHYARLKTPISYYGGKQSQLKIILPLIPPHDIYTEVFFGGGALYFAKSPSRVEVINDHDREVINFYEQLKKHTKELKVKIDATLHSRQLYREALTIYRFPHLFTPTQRAWAFWIVTNQGFNNCIGSWTFDIRRSTRGLQTKTYNLDALAQRLENTQIECHEALSVLKTRDSVKTFHYVDPPYMGANQGHYKGYDLTDYQELLRVLANLSGSFLLSGYPSETLSLYVQEHGWHEKRVARYVSSSKAPRKEEILVANYDLNRMEELSTTAEG